MSSLWHAQYQWLKQTLEPRTAKWEFVFAHHVMGTGRGGVEIADQYEWGGNNASGSTSSAEPPSFSKKLTQTGPDFDLARSAEALRIGEPVIATESANRLALLLQKRQGWM